MKISKMLNIMPVIYIYLFIFDFITDNIKNNINYLIYKINY